MCLVQFSTITGWFQYKYPIKKPFIVVVEDDGVLAEFLIQKLLQQQMNVAHYTSGLEAVAGITSLGTKTDLILLDISLPDIDGFDVLKQLSPFQKLHTFPLLFQTLV